MRTLYLMIEVASQWQLKKLLKKSLTTGLEICCNEKIVSIVFRHAFQNVVEANLDLSTTLRISVA